MLSAVAANRRQTPAMARPRKLVNWIDVKRQYVEGTATVAELSRQLGTPNERDMQRRAKAENWPAARKAFQERVAARAQKAAEDRAFRSADEINNRQHRLAGKLLDRLEKAIEGDAPIRAQDMKAFIESLEKGAEQERLSAGLPTTPKRIELSGELALEGDGRSVLASKLDAARRKLKRMGAKVED